MIGKADLVIKEVVSPPNHWCKTGHVAPSRFPREGSLKPDSPTKFFQVVSSQMPTVNGVYCEPCVIIANAVKRSEVLITPR